MVHKYLFMIEKGQIEVLSYDENLKKFSYERNRGEKRFVIEEDFWKWWERTVSFVPSCDQVDFCFIYDDNTNIMNYEYETVEESSWKYNHLEAFFIEMTEYNKILLKDGLERWEKKIDKGNIEFSDNAPRIFFTNLRIKEENHHEELAEARNIKETRPIIQNEESKEISPLARLFIEQIQREQRER